MSQVWYYVDDNVDVGPVSRTQLRLFLQSRRGGPPTLVWCETLDNWKRAGEVSEFADAFAQPPGPIRSSTSGRYGAPAARRDPAPAHPYPPAPLEDERPGALVVAAWIAAGCIGAVAAVALIGNMLLPAALVGIAWLTLYKCRVEPAGVPMLAVVIGHTAWMLAGYIILTVTGRPAPHATIVDVVLVAALTIWFGVARSRAAAIGVLAYQVLSLLTGLAQGGPRSISGVGATELTVAYYVHMALRVIGIGACIYAVVVLRRGRAEGERPDERPA